MKESTYDFKILFEKMDDELKNDSNLATAVKNIDEVDEHIKYLKDFYDVNEQQSFEVLTKA